MSRYQEYERLKVKLSRYNVVVVLSIISFFFVAIYGYESSEQDTSIQTLYRIVLIGIIIFGCVVAFFRQVLEARVKAMENRNFSESYVQQDIGIRQGPVQGYSSTPVTKTASIEAELQKLNDMRARGVINDDEYAKMRAKLFE